MCNSTRQQTLRAHLGKCLHVYCMNLKVPLTMYYGHWYRCLKCEFFSCVLIFKLVKMKNLNIPTTQVCMVSSPCFGPQNTYLKHSHLFQEHLYIKVYCRPSYQWSSYVQISEIMGKICWFRKFGLQWEYQKLGQLSTSGHQVAYTDVCLQLFWHRISHHYSFYFFLLNT